MTEIVTTIFNRKKEILLLLASNIPACLLFNWILLGNHYFTEWSCFFIATLMLFLATIILHNILTAANSVIRKKLPQLNETYKRVVFSLLTYISITICFILCILWIYKQMALFQFTISLGLIRNVLLVGVISNLIVGSTYEIFYTFEKFKESLIENESLKKEKLQKQFDLLKAKVNPHFLFNSLSSLSSLVAEDTEKADAFLNEMSKVYRYILKSNQQELSTLQQELSFIQSYYFLLKMRYGNAVQFHFKTDNTYNHYKLPSLALQLLVDNAVQHNAVMKNQPLLIRIETNENETITVKNNLQKKILHVNNSNNSLKGIEAKYDLLKLAGFTVKKTATIFMVTLPLASPEFHEQA